MCHKTCDVLDHFMIVMCGLIKIQKDLSNTNIIGIISMKYGSVLGEFPSKIILGQKKL